MVVSHPGSSVVVVPPKLELQMSKKQRVVSFVEFGYNKKITRRLLGVCEDDEAAQQYMRDFIREQNNQNKLVRILSSKEAQAFFFRLGLETEANHYNEAVSWLTSVATEAEFEVWKKQVPSYIHPRKSPEHVEKALLYAKPVSYIYKKEAKGGKVSNPT